MKLVINRKKWYRGQAHGSRLLREDGQMCCLGFYALACGLKKKEILNNTTPGEVVHWRLDKVWKSARQSMPKDYQWLISVSSFTENSKPALKLIAINDASETSEAEREQLITKIFKRKGVEVIFKN